MTETPKTNLHINPDKINYSRGYKLNPEKLVGAPPSVLPPLLGAFYYTEDYEYFDLVKPYLDIPEPRKSLEEIKQELDEKFEKLIEKTKRNFYASKLTAERNYEYKFDKIFDNFEYAKRNGYFLQYLSFTTSGNASIGNGIVPNSYLAVSGSLNNPVTSFEIRCGTNNAGYYTIGAGNVRYYMNEKPNWLVRNCAKIFFDFTWKSV
jgi:hypothetical protein